jgi:hypothetical protein
VALHRKPIPLTAWHLAAPADMIAALSDLSALGWRGGVNCDDTGVIWRLEINADGPTRQITASLGDWLVDDMGLRLLTAAEVADNYDETEG